MAKKRPTGNSSKKDIATDLGNSQEVHEKNGQPKKSQKHAKKENRQKSSYAPYLFYIGLSITFAAAAIVFTNEDVQMYLVKLTSLGSDPLGTIMKAEEKGEDTKKTPTTQKRNTQTQQNKPSSQENVKPKQDTADVRKEEIDSKKLTERSDAPSEKRESKTEENLEESEVVKEAEQLTKADKEMGGDNAVKKAKVKRTDYEKHEITSKEDFKIRKKLDAAEELLEKGDAEGAIKKYDSILQAHPESPRALWGKGMAVDTLAEKQHSNKLLEEAIQLMDKALRLPTTPEPLLLKIAVKLAYRQTFRGWAHKEAETWRYLIAKYPDNLEFQRKYGVSFLMMNKVQDAKTVFEKILERDPNDGFSLVHLGFILKTSDLNYDKAIPMMQRGIDSKAPGTSDGRFFYHLGDAYQRVNQTDKAKEIYQQGADLGLFLSRDQRSLYNAATKLTSRPWWTPEQTPYKKYLTLLEKNWEIIRDEGLAQLDPKTGGFKPEEENLREKGDWKQFTLYQRGQQVKHNCEKAPQTCALMEQIPDAKSCKRGQIKFSVMHPGVHVWPHTGPTNCRLRAHLGLKIPDGPKIRVGNETGTWKEGKFIIIDDSFEHEVWHDGTELRLILIVDFWHPDIPESERRGLSPI